MIYDRREGWSKVGQKEGIRQGEEERGDGSMGKTEGESKVRQNNSHLHRFAIIPVLVNYIVFSKYLCHGVYFSHYRQKYQHLTLPVT